MKQRRKISKVVRKWLNIQSSADEFQSDYAINDVIGRGERRRKSCSDDGGCVVVPEELSGSWLDTNYGTERPRFEEVGSQLTKNLRMFVGTWNVGGKSPSSGLNLRDWFNISLPAHIYVLGFQEIVPLNPGNVLGAEDNGPAAKWLSLIREALNNSTIAPNNSSSYNYTPDYVTNISQSSLHQQHHHVVLQPRVSFSDLISLEDELEEDDFERFISIMNSVSYSSEEGSPIPHSSLTANQNQYCLAASKQMGSISISMTLHQTTFCFVCTHLASGEKEGDEVKRNSDVMEILKRTRFNNLGGMGRQSSAHKILDHDKIIWLGDLNYRLASGCEDTFDLLKKSDWQALLEKDQLKIEQNAGRVFKGWKEGKIYFAPTYKYLSNSEHYVVQTPASKEKQRIPAWCDRILWKGEGLKQICYVRGESKFSDHRPVYSLFSVQLDLANDVSNLSSTSISCC